MSQHKLVKSAPVFVLLGTLDELNAHLGLAKQYVCREIQDKLEAIQKDIFSVSGEIAGGPSADAARLVPVLEAWIDQAMQCLPQANTFAIPGKTIGGAHLDIARTIARRFEREAVRFQDGQKLPRTILVWANRLSDALFAFARKEDSLQQPADEKGCP